MKLSCIRENDRKTAFFLMPISYYPAIFCKEGLRKVVFYLSAPAFQYRWQTDGHQKDIFPWDRQAERIQKQLYPDRKRPSKAPRARLLGV